MAPPNMRSLGGIGTIGAKLALKAAIMVVMNDQNITAHIASVMYWNETGREFGKLSQPNERQLWITRARSALQGLSETVGT